jgi:hypothetical protein
LTTSRTDRNPSPRRTKPVQGYLPLIETKIGISFPLPQIKPRIFGFAGNIDGHSWANLPRPQILPLLAPNSTGIHAKSAIVKVY